MQRSDVLKEKARQRDNNKQSTAAETSENLHNLGNNKLNEMKNKLNKSLEKILGVDQSGENRVRKAAYC